MKHPKLKINSNLLSLLFLLGFLVSFSSPRAGDTKKTRSPSQVAADITEEEREVLLKLREVYNQPPGKMADPALQDRINSEVGSMPPERSARLERIKRKLSKLNTEQLKEIEDLIETLARQKN